MFSVLQSVIYCFDYIIINSKIQSFGAKCKIEQHKIQKQQEKIAVLNDKIAGIQWLITPEENDILKAYYGSKYIKLQNSQVKVENIYVFPEFRGRGFANFLIVRLLTMARELGYNYCICQIEARNTISLNEHIIIGFKFLKYIENNKVLGFGWSSR